jgi:hypothetical protein
MDQLLPLRAPVPELLDGALPVGVTGSTLAEFWAWALSDLRANTTRGLLAEYLVAAALGVHTGPRIEWDSHDVTAPDGTRVEVKSGAHLQAWNQRIPSKIVFSSLRAKTWSPATGYSAKASYNADVYVFAVQLARSHDAYDAPDPAQWAFWAASRREVAGTGQQTLSLGRVQAFWGEPLGYHELASAIHRAGSRQPDAQAPRESRAPIDGPILADS